MSKWKSLNEEEEQMIREMGQDPNGMVVNRIGQDYLEFLELKTRKEIIICLYKRGQKAAR